MDLTKVLNTRINQSQPGLTALDRYWRGTQPQSYLTAESAEALGNRFRTLNVNYARLSVSAKEERLRVMAYRAEGSREPDARMAALWAELDMDEVASLVHTDALTYGRAYVMVWAAEGTPTVSVESPRTTSVVRDPVTRQVTAGMKRWLDENGDAKAVLFTPTEVRRLSANGAVADPTMFPSDGWTVTETIPNPFGVVPIIPFTNQARLADEDGVSEFADLIDLIDALNKVMVDTMVASEFSAKPRRWATGLEIQEDNNGEVIDPFPSKDGKLWQADDPDTKFGQFPAANLGAFESQIKTLTNQISAISCLPAHYLGQNNDSPPSADAIRSAEASLVARCYRIQRTFTRPWTLVAALIVAVIDGSDPLTSTLRPVWASPETRTQAQAADAAQKLVAVGVPLGVVLEDVMGWDPDRVNAVAKQAREEAVLKSITSAPAPAPAPSPAPSVNDAA